MPWAYTVDAEVWGSSGRGEGSDGRQEGSGGVMGGESGAGE